MGDLLIRDVDETSIRMLKCRAEANGTSLQQEAKKALTNGARPSPEERLAALKELHRTWGDRPPLKVGGAEIVREMRDEQS